MIPRSRNRLCEERLNELNLFPLKRLRLRGKLIAVFKIFIGFTNVNPEAYFTVDHSNITRNNGYKVIVKRFETNDGKYFLFNVLSVFGMD